MAQSAPKPGMDALIKQFENLWHSERLVYSAVEQNEETKKFIHEIYSDPVTLALAISGTTDARTLEQAEQDLKMAVDRAHIAVFICLPADGSKTGDKTDGQLPKAGKRIGFLEISKRGIHSGMISIALLPEYQNKGYGRESLNWILDFGFRYRGLHRISIGTVEFNERALGLYESMGFTSEGRRREMIYVDFVWYDLIELSMLVHEWKALRGLS